MRATHFDYPVTVEGLAEVILTMRWIDLEGFCVGLNRNSHKKLSAANVYDWARDCTEIKKRMREKRAELAAKSDADKKAKALMLSRSKNKEKTP